jgi:hypothetical protein
MQKPRPQNYIFLDFDGVLHVEGSTLFYRLPLFEQALRRLEFTEVVISSTWRLSHGLDELRSYFSSDLRHRVAGVTPCLSNGLERGGRQDEIRRFIAAQGAESALVRWVALDDMEELFDPFCQQLIHVNSTTGLAKKDVARLIEMLEGNRRSGS